jgi:anti-anti-sigma factor
MTYRYGNPALDCDGAEIHATCRQLATVVTISGDIDPGNLDRVTACASRFILAEKPFVLDLSGVNSFSSQCISLLYTIDDHCYDEGVEWSLITSQSVSKLLRTAGAYGDFPIAGSVPDALHHYADEIEARRRLLPLFTKKSA